MGISSDICDARALALHVTSHTSDKKSNISKASCLINKSKMSNTLQLIMLRVIHVKKSNISDASCLLKQSNISDASCLLNKSNISNASWLRNESNISNTSFYFIK